METNQRPGVQKCAGPMRGNKFYQTSEDQHIYKEIGKPHTVIGYKTENVR